MAKDDKDKTQLTPPAGEGTGAGEQNAGLEGPKEPTGGETQGAGASKPAGKERIKELQKEAQAAGFTLVDPEGLKKMMDQMGSMEATIKKQGELIQAVADRDRLENFNRKNKVPEDPQVRITRLNHDGRMIRVVAWTNLTIDEVYKNSNGAYVERQMRRVILRDFENKNDKGEPTDIKVDIPYLDFLKASDKINAAIKTRTTDNEGNIILHVQDEQGVEFDIAAIFVN